MIGNTSLQNNAGTFRAHAAGSPVTQATACAGRRIASVVSEVCSAVASAVQSALISRHDPAPRNTAVLNVEEALDAVHDKMNCHPGAAGAESIHGGAKLVEYISRELKEEGGTNRWAMQAIVGLTLSLDVMADAAVRRKTHPTQSSDERLTPDGLALDIHSLLEQLPHGEVLQGSALFQHNLARLRGS